MNHVIGDDCGEVVKKDTVTVTKDCDKFCETCIQNVEIEFSPVGKFKAIKSNSHFVRNKKDSVLVCETVEDFKKRLLEVQTGKSKASIIVINNISKGF